MAGVPAVVYTPQGHIFSTSGAIPGVTDRPRLRPLFLALRRFAEARADRVVALTPADLEEQVALGLAPREKYAVIHNGVDPSPFEALPDKAEARRLLGLPLDATLVIAVGRLSPEKGQDIFLEALERLRRTHPHVQGLLVGDGPMRAALEARPSACAVHFLGLRTDVPLCLRAADLFVLPSRYEAQGMVVVEAMMAGLPVVAMRVGGVPGILAHGETGILTSEAELPRDLAVLLDDPARAAALAGAGRRYAQAHLSTRSMVDRYAALYAELLGGRA
jgi:glycosyltransferase involved in cell wall biosynthesis